MYSKQQPKCTVHTPFRKPYFCTTLLCEEGVLCCNESVMDSILFQRKQRDLWQGQSAAIKSQERVWATSPFVFHHYALPLAESPCLVSLSVVGLFTHIRLYRLNTFLASLSLSLSLSHRRPFILFLSIHCPLPSVLLSLTPITLQYLWPWAEE